MWGFFSGVANARRTQAVLIAWLPPVLLTTFGFAILVLPSIAGSWVATTMEQASQNLRVNPFLFCGILAFIFAVLGFMLRIQLYRIVEGYTWPRRLSAWRVARAHEPQRAWLEALKETQRARFHSAKMRSAVAAANQADPNTANLRAKAQQADERQAKWDAKLSRADDRRRRRGRTSGLMAVSRPWHRPLLTFKEPSDEEGRWENPYPSRDMLLPTKVGNSFRAIELYGSLHFGLDSQILWHELVAGAAASLQEGGADAELHADTFLSMFWSAVAFAASALASVIYLGDPLDHPVLIASAIGGWLVAVMAYRGLVGAAREWGTVVQAIVNSGKEPLRERYGLRVPESLEDERSMWEALTSFVFYGDSAHARALDRWRNEDPKQQPTSGKSGTTGPAHPT